MNELKQYTGLQKAIRQLSKTLENDPAGCLAAYLGVSRETILKWLRLDGAPLMTPTNVDSPIYKAVHANGGTAKAAAQLGVTTQAVRQWIAQGYVPTKRVAEFSIQFGVPREQILSPKVRSASGAGGEL